MRHLLPRKHGKPDLLDPVIVAALWLIGTGATVLFLQWVMKCPGL